MERYNVTSSRSSSAPLTPADRKPLGSAGPRLPAFRAVERRLSWPLLGSIAVHVCTALIFMTVPVPMPSPSQLAPQTVALVFAPATRATHVEEPSSTEIAPEPTPSPEQPRLPAERIVIPEPEPPPPVDLKPPPVMPAVPPTPPRPPPPPRRPPRARSADAGPAAQPPADAHPAPNALSTVPPSQSSPAAISPGWTGALSAWLQANKTYPDEARQRGDEGRATVRFTVDREGRVLDFLLLSGTGSAILDAAVGRLLRGARLPPFPVGMEQERITITLQIRYALER